MPPATSKLAGSQTSLLCVVLAVAVRVVAHRDLRLRRHRHGEASAGRGPWSRAVASTNALNVEPAWKPGGVAVPLGDDVVEVGLAELLVAAHRPRLREGAHVAGAGLDHGQAADGLVGRIDVVAHGPVGRLLHPRVEGGADGEPARAQQLAPLLGGLAEGAVLHQHVGDVVAEERRPGVDAAVVGLGHVEPEVALLGLGGLLAGDDVQLGHPVQDDVAALQRLVRAVGRVVAGRVLDQAGQHRRLAQVEVLGVGVEVVAGGGLDAEGAVAEVGDVEVALEDPVLGVVLLERDRVAQLADLALVGVVGRRDPLRPGVGLAEQGQLDHLLGDRRATLDHAAAGLVGDQRAERAAQVERAVLVEAGVLDRDDRLTMVREIWLSGTLTRFSSYSVAIRLPLESRILVFWASGLGLRAPPGGCPSPGPRRGRRYPSTPANGMARPATTTPMTAATAAMTPRWESTRPGVRRSSEGAGMATKGTGGGASQPFPGRLGLVTSDYANWAGRVCLRGSGCLPIFIPSWGGRHGDTIHLGRMWGRQDVG